MEVMLQFLQTSIKAAILKLQEFVIVACSFLVFGILDWVDQLLCVVFRLLDLILDPEITPCYCEHSAKPLALNSLSLSITLYERKHLKRRGLLKRFKDVIHLARKFKRTGLEGSNDEMQVAEAFQGGEAHDGTEGRAFQFVQKSSGSVRGGGLGELGCMCLPTNDAGRPRIRSDSSNGYFKRRWSDCGCVECNYWQSDDKELLYVHVDGKGLVSSDFRDDGELSHNNIIFIHGFLSSSSFWTHTVFPYLSESTKSSYRLFAIDLLGFGKSPKPRSCFYTIADHVEKIRVSVLQPYKLGSFHLVAHSMGCVIALGLACSYPDSVKSVTLLSPPYFPVPHDKLAGWHILCQVAPQRIWPPIAFGVSVMSWYEHLGRMVCFIVCRNHKLWETIVKVLAINRIPRFLVQDFIQHTHHSAWHIFHNVICGGAYALDDCLDVLNKINCGVNVIHGSRDTLVPLRCSLDLQKKLPKAHLSVVDGKDHVTIVFGREQALAKTLEEMWRSDAVL